MSRVFLALLSVMLVATSASAECAWVLWNDFEALAAGGTSSSLFLLGATPTFKGCEEQRAAKAKDLLRVTEDDKTGPNVDRVEAREKGNIVFRRTYLKDGGLTLERFRLFCLPDTVDPRGAKVR